MKTTTKTISANFTGLGRQSVTYHETVFVKHEPDGSYGDVGMSSHMLRIIIKSDSHSFQSSAKIERWDGNQWHQVHFMGGDPMKTKLAYSEGPKPQDVQADRKELLRVATAILF